MRFLKILGKSKSSRYSLEAMLGEGWPEAGLQQSYEAEGWGGKSCTILPPRYFAVLSKQTVQYISFK